MKEVPIWEKAAMTIEEAALYSSIGINQIRRLVKDPHCEFALRIGSKCLIKRRLFEQFIDSSYTL